MVDLLGRPSCAECFESCLKREGGTPKKRRDSQRDGDMSNLGGVQTGKSREGSPALEELEKRLGITKRRESAQELGESSPRPSPGSGLDRARERSPLSQRRSGEGGNPHFLVVRANFRIGCSPSPVRKIDGSGRLDGHSTPESERRPNLSLGRLERTPVEDVAKKLFSASLTSSPVISPLRISHVRPNSLSPARKSPTPSKIPVARRQSGGGGEGIRPTPDLVSDYSDTGTQSSGPDSPPGNDADADVFVDRGATVTASARVRERVISADNRGVGKPSPPKATTIKSHAPLDLAPPSAMPSDTACGKCGEAIFGVRRTSDMRGQFVKVPNVPGENEELTTFHTECFRCGICNGIFRDGGLGKAVFVWNEGSACHVEVIVVFCPSFVFFAY
jgi:hypothetical protein